METPLDVLSRAASFVHANEEERECFIFLSNPRLNTNFLDLLPISYNSACKNHMTKLRKQVSCVWSLPKP